MALRFGTDGVRGVANAELTPEFALLLGRAAARVLQAGVFVLGRDTRVSGPLLEAALAAGLASEGVHVERLGVVPTPAVAAVAASSGAAGAVLSASHNAFADNGIKVFAAGGLKLPDAVEARIEHEIAVIAGGSGQRPMGAGVGAITDRDAGEAYLDHLIATLDGRRLDGVRVVLDAANGAASVLGPALLRRLGADVIVINAAPDGVNINDHCGATHPEGLQAAVRAHDAHAGLALDGDADRLIAVDHTGALVDGDHILAVCALDLRARGRLNADTVVVTVMTNLGFRRAMHAAGVRVLDTAVGDRYVLEALDEHGLNLGGEQSGHVIFRDKATTGDGLLTGITLLDAIARTGRPLATLAGVMTRLPQVLLNVRVAERHPDVAAELADEILAVEADLGESGRVLVRASGTEPLVRVMVEADAEAVARAAAERLVAAAGRRFGVAR